LIQKTLQFTENKSLISPGTVYFDPESQEFVVYGNDLQEAGSFAAGDAGRMSARSLAEKIKKTPQSSNAPTKTGDNSDQSKTNNKVTGSYENPYEEDQDIFANAMG